MSDLTLETLNKKTERIFDMLKALAAEVNILKSDIGKLQSDIETVKKNQDDTKIKADLLYKGYKPDNKSYKDFSDAEIFEMKQHNSYSKLSKQLGCSIGTLQLKINKYKKENNL